MTVSHRLNTILFLCLFTLLGLSLFVGPSGFEMGENWQLIVMEIRLPRSLLAVMVGVSLGMCGAAMQGLLRNPLADPGVLGISASAGLGAVVALYLLGVGSFSFFVPLSAVLGALLATAVLAFFAFTQSSILGLILAGVALSTLAGAMISLVMNLTPDPVALSEIITWLMGSVANRSFWDVALAAPFMAAGAVCLYLAAPSLRGLTLGEEVATSLGLDMQRLKLLLILGTALMVGASVATAGTIGFIGLIVPHMVRPFVAYDPAKTILPSGLAGGCLLLLADLALRLFAGEVSLQLGVLTALIGAPFFLYLVVRLERGRL